jgi:hypothetical protein
VAANRNSDLYVVDTSSPNDDNDKLVSASLIERPIEFMVSIPPLKFNLISNVGFIKIDSYLPKPLTFLLLHQLINLDH